ncbi:MAG TPA: DUF533 domain-containing protein [Labilithrix sp.]|nr:DUF533 domain-containing protein [Labilithrix sp.]
MSIAEDEALACLKVLVAVAKADGRIRPDERKSLAAAIGGFQLPADTSVEELLSAELEIDVELAKITSAEAKEQVYRSAHFLVNADGTSAPEEHALLARIEAATAPSETLRSQLAGLAPPTRSVTLLTSLRSWFRSKS